jgi:predicted DNA-binding protein (MmcQ/YjbR family)
MKTKGHDKLLDRIRSVCLALPESKEGEAWGHPTFRAGKKMFAACGADPGAGITLGIKVGFDQQDELLKDSRFFPTLYAAHQGWVSLTIDGKADWDEIGRLVMMAYRQVALQRMLRALEAQQ